MPMLEKPTNYFEMLEVCDPIGKDIEGDEWEFYLNNYLGMTDDEWSELRERFFPEFGTISFNDPETARRLSIEAFKKYH